jgi:hypothetical protein
MTDTPWPDIDYSVIACQQVLGEDHSVFSLQWVVVPPDTPGRRVVKVVLRPGEET